MHVVVFASQKGGSGKTTLAGHVAVQAERSGAGPVALVDTDPQRSLTDWWHQRDSGSLCLASIKFPRLMSELERLHDAGVNLVVVDTPAAIVMAIRNVALFADLVVVPVRPSPHDLRALGATVALIKEVGKPMALVINGANARAKITGEAATALNQHGIAAPIIVHQRVNFASSMIDGLTVMETDEDSRSSEEIKRLWDYLQGRLETSGQQWTTRFFSNVTRLLAG